MRLSWRSVDFPASNRYLAVTLAQRNRRVKHRERHEIAPRPPETAANRPAVGQPRVSSVHPRGSKITSAVSDERRAA